MTNGTVTYRPRTACRLLSAGGTALGTSLFFILMGWVQMEPVLLGIALAVALPSLLALLVGWSMPRETLG